MTATILVLTGFIAACMTAGAATALLLTRGRRRRDIAFSVAAGPDGPVNARLVLRVDTDGGFSLWSAENGQHTAETLTRVLDEVMDQATAHYVTGQIGEHEETTA